MVATAEKEQDGHAGFLSVMGTRSFLYHTLCFGLLGSTYALYKHVALLSSSPPPLPSPSSSTRASPAQTPPAPKSHSSPSKLSASDASAYSSATRINRSEIPSPHLTSTRTTTTTRTQTDVASSEPHVMLWYALGGGILAVLARAGYSQLVGQKKPGQATDSLDLSSGASASARASATDPSRLLSGDKLSRQSCDGGSRAPSRTEQSLLEQINRRAMLADRDVLSIFEHFASLQ